VYFTIAIYIAKSRLVALDKYHLQWLLKAKKVAKKALVDFVEGEEEVY
jgi:hypothetical protein